MLVKIFVPSYSSVFSCTTSLFYIVKLWLQYKIGFKVLLQSLDPFVFLLELQNPFTSILLSAPNESFGYYQLFSCPQRFRFIKYSFALLVSFVFCFQPLISYCQQLLGRISVEIILLVHEKCWIQSYWEHNAFKRNLWASVMLFPSPWNKRFCYMVQSLMSVTPVLK